jgi:flagellar basal body rod protein FlgG
MNAMITAQYGMLAASRRFEASAQRTVRFGIPGSDVDLGREVVEQVMAKHEFSANLGVIRTADKMTDTLLDLIA